MKSCSCQNDNILVLAVIFWSILHLKAHKLSIYPCFLCLMSNTDILCRRTCQDFTLIDSKSCVSCFNYKNIRQIFLSPPKAQLGFNHRCVCRSGYYFQIVLNWTEMISDKLPAVCPSASLFLLGSSERIEN